MKMDLLNKKKMMMTVHSNIVLRPYQEDLINKIKESFREGNKRIILCAPTGGGKTVMFSKMIAESLKKNNSVIVFTHRTELLKQAGGTFERFGIYPEVIDAGSTPDLSKPFHVSMIETFNARIDEYQEFLSSRKLIVIDEAHLNTFTKIFKYINENTFVIGATATPYRKGKQVPALDEFYTDIIQAVDTPDLLELGFLTPVKTYGVPIDMSGAKLRGEDYDVSHIYEENKMWHGVVDNWERLSKNEKTILFASNVKNSKQVCEEFNERGYIAKHIDGKTSQKERESILEWFDKTPNAIVCNCGILNAGFDQEDIKTVILYRATTSLPLFMQMCGRGSRIAENKDHFKILDFGNNVQRHGFWEERRKWSLKKDETKASKEGAANTKTCMNCGAMVYLSVKKCPYCGDEILTKSEKEQQEIELKLIENSNMNPIKAGIYIAKFKALVKTQQENNYHKNWILYQLKSEEEVSLFVDFMGYDKKYKKRIIERIGLKK